MRLREEEPDWYEFKDGLYNMGGVDERGQRYSYKLAVRKTPDAWAFLAYDMTDSVRGGQQLNRALVLSVLQALRVRRGYVGTAAPYEPVVVASFWSFTAGAAAVAWLAFALLPLAFAR